MRRDDGLEGIYLISTADTTRDAVGWLVNEMK